MVAKPVARMKRFGVLATVATLLFGLLGARRWMLQIVQFDTLQESVDELKIKRVRLAPERGRIFDAAGRPIAENERSLMVSLAWEVLASDTDRAELFGRLAGWLAMPVPDMEKRYDSGRYSRYEPMPVKEDVAEPIAIALLERIEDFPGLAVVEDWRRVYPYAPLASRVLGYTGHHGGRRGHVPQARLRHVGERRVGRTQRIESQFEDVLHGRWGEAVYEVDAANRIVRTLSVTLPVNGMDVQLSIDLELQQYAERLLQTQLALRRTFSVPNPLITDPETGRSERRDPSKAADVNYEAPAGSVIVMDHETGGVAAMASYPTFDNRWFTAEVSSDTFEEIFASNDPDEAVLANRAIQGQYNLGSTFKAFVAYAALAAGRLEASDIYDDRGTYKLASVSDDVCATGIQCVYRNATCPDGEPCVYGPVNVQTSLAVSSDAFYYRLGEEFYLASRSLLQDHVRRFGFGSPTGIDLPFEFAGRIPDDELKQQLIESGALGAGETPRLLVGDEVNLVIGQGLLAASPMQLAVGYATLANGGSVLTPRVTRAVYEPGAPTDSAICVPTASCGAASGGHARSRCRTASTIRSLRASARTSQAPASTDGRRLPRSCSMSATPIPPFRPPARPAPHKASRATTGMTRRRSPHSASIRHAPTPSSPTSRRPASDPLVPHPS